MAFFSLLGRLGLDTKPFDQGIANAERKASGFAHHIEKNVAKKFNHLFGAGLITGAVVSQLHQVFDLFSAGSEEAKGIEELRKRFQLTSESAQALAEAAKQDSVSIEEFLQKAGESKSIDATIKRLKELREHVKFTAEETENLGGHSDIWEQLGTWAAKARSTVISGIRDTVTLGMSTVGNMKEGYNPFEAWGYAMDDLSEQNYQDSLNAKKATEDDDQRFREMMEQAKKKPTPTGGHGYRDSTSLTAWQQVGAFSGISGMSGDAMLRESQKTNQILTRIESLTQQQVRALADSGRLFG